MYLKLNVLREINDHDGYCSDAENEYTQETFTEYVTMPEVFEHFILENKINEFNWELVLGHLVPKLNIDGSCYCEVGEMGITSGLSQHDYRFTILSYEIISKDEIK